MATATIAPPSVQVAPETTDAPVAKRGRKKGANTKKDYPHQQDEKGKDIPFKAVPSDWDSKIHKVLKVTEFEDECVWHDFMISYFESKVESHRKSKAKLEALGDVETRKAASKLESMAKRFEELKAQLASQGVDVSALLD